MGTVEYTNDCTTISSAVLSEVLRCAQRGRQSDASHFCNLDRVLSTAGLIAHPEGATEVIQEIFVDTDVARIV